MVYSRALLTHGRNSLVTHAPGVGAFLDAQPFIALFLVVGVDFAAGRISIGGFSLGSGAILFFGLAVGAIAPKAAPPGFLGVK